MIGEQLGMAARLLWIRETARFPERLNARNRANKAGFTWRNAHPGKEAGGAVRGERVEWRARTVLTGILGG